MNDRVELDVLAQAIQKLRAGFASLPDYQDLDLDSDRACEVMLCLAERLTDNFPYQHPLYLGQMLKPPHPVARLAYALTMIINPNNHALDGGRATSAMEKEVIAQHAQMVGWKTHLGHLTGGGTIANLEALWVARETQRGNRVLASSQAHYTHGRMSKLLEMPFSTIATDEKGRMRVDLLAEEIAKGDVAVVVVTLGTTGLGSLDPLDRIIPLARQANVWVHVDAAYGGYFKLVPWMSNESIATFSAMREADSVVIDPHKHGLQPYGCGAVLFRDPAVGRVYKHDSPYTYFTSSEMHLGEISLECSRAGASASALWATQQLLPLAGGGEFSKGLQKGLLAAKRLHEYLLNRTYSIPLFEPDLDIVVWGMSAETASQASQRAQAFFAQAARHDVHLALVRLPRSLVAPVWPELRWDDTQVVALRSCLMKPDHLDWLAEITRRLDLAAESSR